MLARALARDVATCEFPTYRTLSSGTTTGSFQLEFDSHKCTLLRYAECKGMADRIINMREVRSLRVLVLAATAMPCDN